LKNFPPFSTPLYASNFSPYYLSFLQIVAYDTAAKKSLEEDSQAEAIFTFHFYRWLQMILLPRKVWKKIAKQGQY
jgi:hypothetical protein